MDWLASVDAGIGICVNVGLGVGASTGDGSEDTGAEGRASDTEQAPRVGGGGPWAGDQHWARCEGNQQPGDETWMVR